MARHDGGPHGASVAAWPRPARALPLARTLLALVVLVGTAIILASAGPASGACVCRPGSVTGLGTGDAAAPKPLVLAYYYIWFDHGSWDRAKTDLPTLGAYASSDPAVIAQHVAWAKAAGIDALIVSWKHEPRLDAPLATLVEAARAQGLKLVLLYQGLDFSRNPLPVSRVAADLGWFMSTYGNDPIFDTLGSTSIILSGTPSFTADEIATVRAAIAAVGPALLLGTERDAASYAARSSVLDGDAYYWSSVDPARDKGYAARLQSLGAAVHADQGAWLAPVAPGFDARLIGGTRVVARAGGATYRTEWQTALSSDPDALAIISWNEFSENSFIEPSGLLGATYLDLTAELVRTTLGRPAATDPAAATAGPLPTGAGASPSPSDGTSTGSTPRPVAGAGTSTPGAGGPPNPLLALLAALVVLAPIGYLGLRSRRSRPRPDEGNG
jgi:hypothetical protein